MEDSFLQFDIFRRSFPTGKALRLMDIAARERLFNWRERLCHM